MHCPAHSDLLRSVEPECRESHPHHRLTSGETLVGIDFRPANNLLYGLGVNATTDTATLYIISLQTGVATAVGPPLALPFDLPSGGYGFDFNSAVDRIRVTTETGLNFRLNPYNGHVAGHRCADGAFAITGAAYTNNQPGPRRSHHAIRPGLPSRRPQYPESSQ